MNAKQHFTQSSVLFICTANICRSPMAAAFFNALVKQDHSTNTHWNISSAGTWTTPGLTSPGTVIKTMMDFGLDITSHRSQAVNATLLEKHQLILTMEQGHKEALQFEFQNQAHKIYMLSEMVGLTDPIVDPANSSEQMYKKIAINIQNWLMEGKDRIYTLALENL